MAKVKICGVTTFEVATAAIEAGAEFIGFVFYRSSSRYIELGVAKEIVAALTKPVAIVGLFVDADDKTIEAVLAEVPLSILQLHGHESAERVREIKHRFNLPVIKAVAIGSQDDFVHVKLYEGIADWVLLDAKSDTCALPGGNGIKFDWQLLRSFSYPHPWLLAGGLTPNNVEEAIRISGASAVDVSSGVEDYSGKKNISLIREFVTRARAAG